jgi:hypothetical protein
MYAARMRRTAGDTITVRRTPALPRVQWHASLPAGAAHSVVPHLPRSRTGRCHGSQTCKHLRRTRSEACVMLCAPSIDSSSDRVGVEERKRALAEWWECALELDVPLPRPTPAHELHQAMEQEEETGNAEEEDEEEEPPPSNCKRSDSV